jgi:predicted DNA-binding transcriptional regulator AlpA
MGTVAAFDGRDGGGTSTASRILRAVRVEDLAALEPAALAEAVTYLQGIVAFGTQRLGAVATAATQAVAEARAEAHAAAAPALEELIPVQAVAQLTGRSRSWIEHHRDVIPGRRQRTPRGRVRWVKREVVQWVRSGAC